MKVFVVAVSQREAEWMARERPDVCHESRVSADRHLKAVKSPPTDSYYAGQYRVYEVGADHAGGKE